MNHTLSHTGGFTVSAEPAAHEAVVFARAEMERYLAAILGVPAGGKGSMFRLELCADAGLGAEGHETSIEPGSIVIRGGGAAGVVFGVYDFLRRCGGCCFSGLGADGEHVPLRKSIALPVGTIRRMPRLWYRGLQFSTRSKPELTRQRIDWMAKNGMNFVMVLLHPDHGRQTAVTVDPATGRQMTVGKKERLTERYVQEHMLPEMRRRGLKLDMNHHNLFFWLPPETYFEQHPEWYALRDGRRSSERKQLCLCTSNPEAVAELIANIKAYLRRTPEARIAGVIPEDDLGMCQCDDCRALDPDPADALKPFKTHRSREGRNPSKSRRYALLLNEVARALRDEFPDVLIGAAAYVDLQWPAPDVTLEPNIVPWLALYWRCGAHPLDHGACPMNAMFLQLIQEWRACHRGPLILYEYYMGMNAQGALPYPQVGVICREWPVLTALGLGGATVQSAAEHHHVYAPNYLAFARCGWEAAVNPEEVLDDFLKGMFGAAAGALRPLYDHYEHKAQKIARGEASSPFLKAVPPAVGCLLPNARNGAYFLDEEGSSLLAACLKRAAVAATDPRERRQLALFRTASSYWRLAARMLHDGYAVARALDAGEARRASALAAEVLRYAEPELDRLEEAPAIGWFPAEKVAAWRRRGYECGLAWFHEIASLPGG